MDSLVSTQWLADALAADDLVVLDASLHLPDSPRKSAQEFAEAHIPGARFLDLASFVDTASPVPKALPTAGPVTGKSAGLAFAPPLASGRSSALHLPSPPSRIATWGKP